MALKNGPNLHLEKIHAHAFGNLARKRVDWETSEENANDAILLLPLQPGMRIDRVRMNITDAANGGVTLDVGYHHPADTDGDDDDGSNMDYWFDGQAISSTGGHESGIGLQPWEAAVKGMHFAVRPRQAITQATAITFLIDYVFVGS